MRLIRGSYAYLIGLFILGASSVISVVAFFFALFSRGCTDNPLLSPFGAQIAGGAVTMILSATFTACISLFAYYVLWNALKKNSLTRPFTLLAAWLFVYAAVAAFTALFYAPPGDAAYLTVLRACKAICPLLFGAAVILLVNGKRRLKIFSIVLSALCALQAPFGYGFRYAFSGAEEVEKKAIFAYASLLLFTVSVILLFIGLCFFIAGSRFDKTVARRRSAQDAPVAPENERS